jgi:hypothetical protein
LLNFRCGAHGIRGVLGVLYWKVERREDGIALKLVNYTPVSRDGLD